MVQNQPINNQSNKTMGKLPGSSDATDWMRRNSMGARAERMRFQELRTYTFPDCFNSVNDKSQFL